MDIPARPPPRSSKLLAYLQLFRAPNVFTAMADVAMGFLFVHQSFEPVGVFVCLLAASCLLYTAGMALNDVYDIEADSRERPDRPLPSGRIAVAWAMRLGYALLLAGVVLGWLADFLYRGVYAGETAVAWRGGIIAVVLALCVVSYDAVLKNTFAGPLAMGACRFFNVLLGMSLGPAIVNQWQVFGYGASQLLVAGGIGLYIAGVTWFARRETRGGDRRRLALATVVMAAGVALLGLFPRYLPLEFRLTFTTDWAWPLLLLLLAATIVRRCGEAIADPTPEQVQAAVKHGVLSLIVLNAAVSLAVAGPVWAIGVLLLLAPTLVLGRWVYST